MLGAGKNRSPFLSPVRRRHHRKHPQGRFRRAFLLYTKGATETAWRPYENLIAAELHNTVPGKVTGSLRFVTGACGDLARVSSEQQAPCPAMRKALRLAQRPRARLWNSSPSGTWRSHWARLCGPGSSA